MRKSRFTESQIISILKELDAGTPATELARKHGIHANTIRLWRDRYADLEASDLARLKQLEDDSRRKDRIIARLTLEVDGMRDLVEKKPLGLSQRQDEESIAGSRCFSVARLFARRLYPQQLVLPPQDQGRYGSEGAFCRSSQHSGRAGVGGDC